LWEGELVRFNGRVQTIEDAEQKQRHEAEKIEMGMGGECGMIVRYCHLQAPEHSRKHQQHSGPETQVRCSHGFLPFARGRCKLEVAPLGLSMLDG
jgi:hypothetical protein